MSETKNKKDYSQGKIYCIRNIINDDIYIGSSCQSLSQRMANHRKDSIKPNRQNTEIYKAMTEFGRKNFYIELVEEYPCENIYQLQKREGEIIRERKPSLNIKVPTRTRAEFKEEEPTRYEEQRKKCKECGKAYRQNHPEIVREGKKKCYYAKKDEYKQKHKEYREKNRQQILEKQRAYREQNKDELNRKRREKYEQLKQSSEI